MNRQEQIFRVDRLSHLLGGLLDHAPNVLKRCGELETWLLEDRLGPVDRPVYIAGLARSGSTLLLELLSRQPEVVTHRYRDFPLLHVPYMWNRYLDAAGARTSAARERAHGDGMRVDRNSPEAFEEVLWMSFFPGLHEPWRTDVMDATTWNPSFERFYRDHVRKLLLLRGGRRYVSKGNYNVTRLPYLKRMFPDARFVIPVRDPVRHVVSLMNQHARFVEGQRDNRRARVHLRRVGHFEFGIDRRPIHTGDQPAVDRIVTCWKQGRDVEGWARYWSLVYDHVARSLARDRGLAEATLLVSLDELCADPARIVHRLLDHCGFHTGSAAVARAAQSVTAPSTATSRLSDDDAKLVRRLTEQTVVHLDPRFPETFSGGPGPRRQTGHSLGGPGDRCGTARL